MANYGGRREGAGRKRMTDEERAAKERAAEKAVIEELIFPAVVQAMTGGAPGPQSVGITLNVALSKTHIAVAYGPRGLTAWCKFFTQQRPGGRDRHGEGYPTLWALNYSQWGVLTALVRSLGHEIKDLPAVVFPPEALAARVALIEARRAAKRARKRERS